MTDNIYEHHIAIRHRQASGKINITHADRLPSFSDSA